MANRAMRRNKAYKLAQAILLENSNRVTQDNILLLQWVLHNYFGFGKKRLNDFDRYFNETIEQCSGNPEWFDEMTAAIKRVLNDGNDSKNSV